MNTCDTCQFWQKESGVMTKFGMACKNQKVSSSEWCCLKDDHACLDEDEAARLYFATGPKFGCIHHLPLIPENPLEQP